MEGHALIAHGGKATTRLTNPKIRRTTPSTTRSLLTHTACPLFLFSVGITQSPQQTAQPNQTVTIYGYRTRYQSRNVKSSCSSRHKPLKPGFDNGFWCGRRDLNSRTIDWMVSRVVGLEAHWTSRA